MAGTIANNFRVLVAQGLVDWDANTFKAIAMKEGFIFNRATHDLYSDVSSYEQATGFGYTVGGITLSGVSIAQNDTDNRADITWNNITWTATGGDVGPLAGVIILNDSIANDPVVGYIDFGGAYTVADGGTATVANVKVRI
jgi:hypothetical protein